MDAHAPGGRRRSVYLASGYGFSDQQRELLLPLFVETLTRLGADVYEPFSTNKQVALALTQAGRSPSANATAPA